MIIGNGRPSKMTTEEKLLEEAKAAIRAVFGSQADEEFTGDSVSPSDIDAIAKKMKFYLFG